MTPDQLADIGLARIRLPAPMAKLQIIHGAARALCNNDTDKVTWRALLRWIGSLDFESEVLEALCIVFAAKGSNVLSASELRRSIRTPSILSDQFIALAFDLPVLIRTWEKSHSGEVPSLYKLDAIEKELAQGRIVPPILSSQLRGLERRADRPFMRQWAYEFDRLQARFGPQPEGHFSYFTGDQGQDATGQFISRRSHLARSSYLRVFALAADQWDMPEDVALAHAMYATPADFSLLKMLPGDPPAWAQSVHQLTIETSEDWAAAIKRLLLTIEEREDGQLLVHFDGPAHRTEKLQVDLEIITVLSDADIEGAEDAFTLHARLPGQVVTPRDSDGNFNIPPWPPEHTFLSTTGSSLRPGLVPAVAKYVGYLNSDLIGRMPYLPVSHSPGRSLIANPRLGGADIKFNDVLVGEFRYWNWGWQPMHQKGIGVHAAVAVTLSMKFTSEIFGLPVNKVIRCWRAIVRTRDNDYGEWEDHTYFGTATLS